MIVFRLCKEKYRNELSGKGAEMSGGRWNSIGNAIIYTAESRALCTAEIAVHTPLGIVPKDYFLISIEIPEDIKIKQSDVNSLPKNWRTFPHIPGTKKIGDEFVNQNDFFVLKVPSAIIQDEFNHLINPGHKDFTKIKIQSVESFKFNQRLFDR
ncbi:RES family NAD+ phosphorylase [Cryomorpha ignava]|uniref:RES family NAD+ phosphorylase n=1 Tax=Cryomorpha ignava TaxID=101383 RepID=A0A7K3WVT3_9FLAO|nr:RES family NAD+ phosphorylase [Cryomorpha ignava]NEN25616.1 RES family NAD+ phosphorylase [Cryomorpha ignava]